MDLSLKMASSNSILASIDSSLDNLQLLFDSDGYFTVKQNILLLMSGLRRFKTFFICTRRLGSQVHLRTEDDNGNRNRILSSLFVRFENFLCRIPSDIESHYLESYQDYNYIMEVECFEAEMEKWYITLSDCLQQQTCYPLMTSQVMDLVNSVLANLEDVCFNVEYCDYYYSLLDQTEALKDIITFLRNFIRFATLPGMDEPRELLAFLTHIEGLAINASHATVCLFLYHKETSYHDEAKRMISALLHKSKHVDTYVYDTCTSVLVSLKHSISELHVLTVNMGADPIVVVEDFLVSIMSMFWEMLQLDTTHLVSLKDQLQQLYEGLRFLRTTMKEFPNNFIDVRTRDLVGVVICDIGILIFSLYREDVKIYILVHHLLEKIQVIWTGVEGQLLQKSPFNFPKTNVLGFLDFLLDSLLEVKSRKVGSYIQSCIQMIEQHILFLKSVLEDLLGLKSEQEDIQTLYSLTVEVTYKMEFLIDQLVLGDIKDSFKASFDSITNDINIAKTNAVKISHCMRPPILRLKKATGTSSQVPSKSSTTTSNEVVGFEIETTKIINRLTRGSKKLQVVAIVGMPGLGKTTLASKVYNSSSVQHHFGVRAWCSISQDFKIKEVLLSLLTQTLGKLPDGYLEKTTGDLVQALWRSLKRRRYLIFLDDVWETQAFDCLKESFPDDLSESRILLTSRQCNVAPETLLDEKPLFLRLLTRNESLELLRRKLFPLKDWPASLYEIGMQIAECCKGLPLTIVVVAGILSTRKQEAWNEVLESLRSGIISRTEQCNNAIELSYRCLPDHLKSCLLYFGVYPEDQVVSVKRLIWYWIAEGFVRKSKLKSLEEVATDYLKTLIGRSLVMEAPKSSSGGVKACRTHDLLHDFCLRKAKEEYFFLLLKGEKELLSFHAPGNLRRLCIYSNLRQFKESKLFCPRLRSLIFHDHANKWDLPVLDVSFIFYIFKLLKVLDIEQVDIIYDFPSEIGTLVQLRFLAIQATYRGVSPSIGNLSNLETFILRSQGGVVLPKTFWNLQKLRHLHLTSKGCGIVLPVDDLDSSPNLYELVSFSTLLSPNWSIMEKQLRKFPNLRQLRCELEASSEGDPDLLGFSFLSRLVSLSVSFWEPSANASEFVFPENLRKLTLSGSEFPWEKIQTVAELPHLEVLKLLHDSFTGETWNVEEGQFPKLRFLKFDGLNIVKWTISDEYEFPNLQKLVLSSCSNLEEIPIDCLQTAPTLEMIAVSYCSDYVTNSVVIIQEAQIDMGNLGFEVHVRFHQEEEEEEA